MELFVLCVCGQFISIDENKIPKYVIENAEEIYIG